MAQRVVFHWRTLTLEFKPSLHSAKLGGTASSLFRICPRTRFSVWRKAVLRYRTSPRASYIFTALILPNRWCLMLALRN